MELDDLCDGIRLSGRWPRPVMVIAATRISGESVSIVVEHEDGRIDKELVFTNELSSLSIVESPAVGWSFSAEPAQFKLATEALRIRMAGVHDPMVAVATSDISPLPHQIRAVQSLIHITQPTTRNQSSR